MNNQSNVVTGKMSLREALEAVVAEATGQHTSAARVYAAAALHGAECHGVQVVENDETGEATVQMLERPTGVPMQGSELKIQLVYVSSNLMNWRGERAKAVKAALKEAARTAEQVL